MIITAACFIQGQEAKFPQQVSRLTLFTEHSIFPTSIMRNFQKCGQSLRRRMYREDHCDCVLIVPLIILQLLAANLFFAAMRCRRIWWETISFVNPLQEPLGAQRWLTKMEKLFCEIYIINRNSYRRPI